MSVIKAFKKRVGSSNKSTNLSCRGGKRALVATLLSLVLTPAAFAAGTPSGDSVAKGDADAGKQKSTVCAACHGADGNSAAPNFPKLAGQGERYLIKQLKDMKSGARSVPEMTGFVQNMPESDMRDIAAFYAVQKGTVEGAQPDTIELGEKIYRAGNMETGLTACTACHGAKGGGLAAAGFPKINGQHAAYTEAQLLAFRAAGRDDSQGKRRDNDGDANMMRSVAAKLSDKEIKALANYLSGLH